MRGSDTNNNIRVTAIDGQVDFKLQLKNPVNIRGLIEHQGVDCTPGGRLSTRGSIEHQGVD